MEKRYETFILTMSGRRIEAAAATDGEPGIMGDPLHGQFLLEWLSGRNADHDAEESWLVAGKPGRREGDASWNHLPGLSALLLCFHGRQTWTQCSSSMG